MADDRLIAALDVHTRAEAEHLVTRLGESIGCYKVGMELFYALGGDIVTWLKGEGKKVFLDLKLHDIPNTVSGGLCSLLRLRPDILNVHTAGCRAASCTPGTGGRTGRRGRISCRDGSDPSCLRQRFPHCDAGDTACGCFS